MIKSTVTPFSSKDWVSQSAKKSSREKVQSQASTIKIDHIRPPTHFHRADLTSPIFLLKCMSASQINFCCPGVLYRCDFNSASPESIVHHMFHHKNVGDKIQ